MPSHAVSNAMHRHLCWWSRNVECTTPCRHLLQWRWIGQYKKIDTHDLLTGSQRVRIHNASVWVVQTQYHRHICSLASGSCCFQSNEPVGKTPTLQIAKYSGDAERLLRMIPAWVLMSHHSVIVNQPNGGRGEAYTPVAAGRRIHGCGVVWCGVVRLTRLLMSSAACDINSAALGSTMRGCSSEVDSIELPHPLTFSCYFTNNLFHCLN